MALHQHRTVLEALIGVMVKVGVMMEWLDDGMVG